jgi:hypothetical protein
MSYVDELPEAYKMVAAEAAPETADKITLRSDRCRPRQPRQGAAVGDLQPRQRGVQPVRGAEDGVTFEHAPTLADAAGSGGVFGWDPANPAE